MSTTRLGLGLGIKFAWMKAPDLEFEKWTQAAQRLWLWLKKPTHGDQTRFRFTDQQLSKILGVGRRCIQYALQWLEEHGIIERGYEYGPREVAGRVIEIVIELAGKAPRTAPAPTSTHKPPAAPATTKPTSQPAPEPEPTPEQTAAAQQAWDEMKRDIAARKAAQATPQRPDDRKQARDQAERTLEGQRLRRKLDETRARLAQARRLTDAQTDPVIRGEIARLEALETSLVARLEHTENDRE